MAKSLKVCSLAEGVETKEQFEFLKRNHCNEIQGFYFYHPKTAKEIEEIFRSQ
ncbi:MAG: hypothetical protein COY58_05075 [Gammaproteobacteria bacterium CG_4_10_14_0_8_um_filter_38_16]|nr:MAG: hypothetical protein COY58_05075 [Gammaproteobacteria bacterium CG_4_10_14_0_8_um_filter_38_16]PJA02810.1 MAG: hypothetical protein COX72_08460 [Gammaproteobacteria bacterium CG_4_10_14_0_2_um_filter_38_22]PJB09666.1 MAG: hypothetical protein CO120_08910 [Gammaproteobacteria bacterium CG_4_9_14_3_um_filter_38_9]